jgi:demethylspheroidene O-methyltransferase
MPGRRGVPDGIAVPPPATPRRRLAGGFRGWRNRLVARPGFQSWASRFFLTRGKARAEGAALFDLVSGFVYSQVLWTVVELDLLPGMLDTPAETDTIARRHGVAPERMRALLQAATALGLLTRLRDDTYIASQRGAALLGVPGLSEMIRHHAVFYRDMADPLALLRDEADTGLSAFWPYVFGAAGAVDPEVTARYSALMEESQALVAEETLRHLPLSDIGHLMDVGGGTGAFLRAVAAAYPAMRLTLFDLPVVAGVARGRFADEGLATGEGARIAIVPGSFRDDPLPRGADAISLVRVLYDHADGTVAALLAKAFDALPPGGRIIISEPMTGGARPHAPGDAYFAFYCMAMRTGRARSAAEIAALLRDAGFSDIATPATHRAFVTGLVTARRPA